MGIGAIQLKKCCRYDFSDHVMSRKTRIALIVNVLFFFFVWQSQLLSFVDKKSMLDKIYGFATTKVIKDSMQNEKNLLFNGML